MRRRFYHRLQFVFVLAVVAVSLAIFSLLAAQRRIEPWMLVHLQPFIALQEKIDTNTSSLHHSNPTTDLNSKHNHAPPPPPRTTKPTDVVISILIPLSGEMGNQLSSIARGMAIQQHWAARGRRRGRQDTSAGTGMIHNHAISTKLILQDTGKTRGQGFQDIQRCFPNLRQQLQLPYLPTSDSTTATTTNHYQERIKQQQEWLGPDLHQRLHVKNGRLEDIDKSLQALEDVMHWTNRTTSTTVNNQTAAATADDLISLPFLIVEGDFVLVDALADKYYEEFRNMFTFDDSKTCCRLVPDSEESVWEIGARGTKKLGFDELDPYRTAHELFGHLQPGDKIAITTRFGADPLVQSHVDALTNRSLQVRVITGQSGVQDFCFLLHAKKELVGVAESTYTLWAGYLGNATKVRLYSIDSASRRKSYFFSHRVFVHYNWTNPKLQQKVHFELYNE